MRLPRRSPAPALGLSAAVLAVAFALAASPAPAYASSVRLMVDPGHGGKDAGAVGPGVQEKDSNLRIGKLIERSARRQGWDVASTRGDDTFVDLPARPARAARFKATDLVSVHSNSTGAKSLGAMTIYRTARSARLGASIMKELDPLTPYADIGNRADVRGLAVLRHASMPSVIVELLSVTSRPENRALRDPARQRDLAEAVVRGIARYHNVKYYPPVPPRPAPKPAVEPIAVPKVDAAPTPPAPATVMPKPPTPSRSAAERVLSQLAAAVGVFIR